jgi:hypothetical protein
MDESLGRVAPIIPITENMRGNLIEPNDDTCEIAERAAPADQNETVAAARRGGESATHLALKRMALLWAQENGYPTAAFEVTLPRCRYRADVAAYRPQQNGSLGHTTIFECKQSRPDFRRDDCRAAETFARLKVIYHRQQILERNLRVHYPTLRTGDTLFPEWDNYDFAAIKHRGYQRVLRELTALQHQLRDGRKFERITRYSCANLFYLVAPKSLIREALVPPGWGLLISIDGSLALARKPIWQESSEAVRLRLLQRIAAAGTRELNRRHGLVPCQYRMAGR